MEKKKHWTLQGRTDAKVVDEERKRKKNFERYGKRRKVHAMMARGEKREGGGRR